MGLVLLIPIYQKGSYGKIDYRRRIGLAGRLILHKVCVIGFSAKRSGAVQFLLSTHVLQFSQKSNLAEGHLLYGLIS